MDPEQIPLRDLHLPAEIGWWPLAPGWWILIGIVAAGVCWFAYRAFLNWRANRARRVALRQLALVAREYKQSGNAVALAKQLSELLRRAVLAYAPRGEVAGLTGDPWLAWLDRGLDEPLFANGPGQRIETLPYRSAAREPNDASSDDSGDDLRDDIRGLIDAVRTRLQTPLPRGIA